MRNILNVRLVFVKNYVQLIKDSVPEKVPLLHIANCLRRSEICERSVSRNEQETGKVVTDQR